MPPIADKSQRRVALSGIPECGVSDVRYIRESAAIADVAVALGVDVSGKVAHCWRVDNHRHGDRKPSIWFNRRNRGHCAVLSHSVANFLRRLMSQRRKVDGTIQPTSQR